MKRDIIALGTVLILIIVGLCGCINNSNDFTATIDKTTFIGSWILEEPVDENYNTIWSFYENNSIKVSLDFLGQNQHFWGNYNIEGGKLELTSFATTPPSASYNYEFSDSNNRLTLSNDGKLMILNKNDNSIVDNDNDNGDDNSNTNENNPPIANDDYKTVSRNSRDNLIRVLDNDIENDINDEIRITSVTQPPNGIVAYNSNFVYYTPDGHFYGDEYFTYLIPLQFIFLYNL